MGCKSSKDSQAPGKKPEGKPKDQAGAPDGSEMA